MSTCHAFTKDEEDKVLGGTTILFVNNHGQAMGAGWDRMSTENTCLNHRSNLAWGEYSAMLTYMMTDHGVSFNIQIVLNLYSLETYL